MHRIIQNIIQVLKVIHGLVDIELRKHFFFIRAKQSCTSKAGFDEVLLDESDYSKTVCTAS